MELIGTSTGFPFGPYSYTSFLGIKILDHVPYSIPLSWFYMGFTSYILASMIVSQVVAASLYGTYPPCQRCYAATAARSGKSKGDILVARSGRLFSDSMGSGAGSSDGQ